jgi:hypothetical protein
LLVAFRLKATASLDYLVYFLQQQFISSLSRHGVGALEILAMDMKCMGMYVSRALSFKGTEFQVDTL